MINTDMKYLNYSYQAKGISDINTSVKRLSNKLDNNKSEGKSNLSAGDPLKDPASNKYIKTFIQNQSHL